jgi:hypothetical protein
MEVHIFNNNFFRHERENNVEGNNPLFKRYEPETP